MKRRSKRQQMALNRELFGPGPKSIRIPKRKVLASPVASPQTPGSCGFCGNCCAPYKEPWTCLWCGVTYPPVEA